MAAFEDLRRGAQGVLGRAEKGHGRVLLRGERHERFDQIRACHQLHGRPRDPAQPDHGLPVGDHVIMLPVGREEIGPFTQLHHMVEVQRGDGEGTAGIDPATNILQQGARRVGVDQLDLAEETRTSPRH